MKEGITLATEEEGTGNAANKKKSMQYASLDLILKMGLVTAEQHLKIHPQGGDAASAPGKKAGKKKGAPENMKDSHQYIRGNFRSALQEHLDRGGKTTNLVFDTTQQENDNAKAPKVFISKCKLQAMKEGITLATDSEGVG